MLLMNRRNAPQLIIQIAYIIDTGFFDIFVANAMLFSTFSIMIGISKGVWNKLKANSSTTYKSKALYHYRVKRTFKMKIECNKLHHYHKYTHNSITDVLCSVLGIDNGTDIEVFYIVPVRQALIVYMEVSSMDHDNSDNVPGVVPIEGQKSDASIFSKILGIGNEQNLLNETFKLELNQRLNLGLKTKSMPVSSELEPGQLQSIEAKSIDILAESSDIKVMVQEDMLSVDENMINIEINVKHT